MIDCVKFNFILYTTMNLKDLLRTEYPEMEFTDNVKRRIDQLETGHLTKEQIIFHICKLLMQISKREKQIDMVIKNDDQEIF